VANTCSEPSTAAAVHDALCGSIATTTRSDLCCVVLTKQLLFTTLDMNCSSEEGTPTTGNADLSSATPAKSTPAGTLAVREPNPRVDRCFASDPARRLETAAADHDHAADSTKLVFPAVCISRSRLPGIGRRR
jgi:hypothetical protein